MGVSVTSCSKNMCTDPYGKLLVYSLLKQRTNKCHNVLQLELSHLIEVNGQIPLAHFYRGEGYLKSVTLGNYSGFFGGFFFFFGVLADFAECLFPFSSKSLFCNRRIKLMEFFFTRLIQIMIDYP